MQDWELARVEGDVAVMNAASLVKQVISHLALEGLAAVPGPVRRCRRRGGVVAPIVASIEVDRSAADVFASATDPSRFSEWQGGVVSGHMDGGETPAVGDRCHTTRRIGFTDRPATSELVRFEPPRRWAVRGIDGPIRASVDSDLVGNPGHWNRR